jgi:hypothetical protein
LGLQLSIELWGILAHYSTWLKQEINKVADWSVPEKERQGINPCLYLCGSLEAMAAKASVPRYLVVGLFRRWCDPSCGDSTGFLEHRSHRICVLRPVPKSRGDLTLAPDCRSRPCRLARYSRYQRGYLCDHSFCYRTLSLLGNTFVP